MTAAPSSSAPDAAKPHVGFVGLGIMGLPMAGHVLAGGFPLTVWNRTASKAAALVNRGARQATDLASLAQSCDILITIVTDAPDVDAVLFGEHGALAPTAPAPRVRTVIDMSTINPVRAREFAERLARRGISFLDAPVTGGDVGARHAALTIMVGGEAGVLERCRTLLETMGKRIVHVGANGAGQMVKACNQVLCAINMIGTCEAISLACKSGIPADVMLDVVTTGAGGSWALENLGRRIVAGDLKPAFMIKLIQKDLRAVMSAAEEARMSLPGTALAMQLFRAVEAMGGADLGTQAMIRAYERLGGFEVAGSSRP